MNETEAMTLLAKANPVQAEDLTALDRPDRFTRRRPNRRSSLAMAVVAVVAAALVGVFAFNGSENGRTTGPPVGATGASGANGANGPIMCTSRDGGKEHVCSDTRVDPTPAALSAAFGKPVVLPRTPLVQPSDAKSAQRTGDCVHDTFCSIRILFPTRGLDLTYGTWGHFPNEAQAEADANANYPDGEALRLGGVSALLLENADEPGSGSIEFSWRGTYIRVQGPENAGVLIDLARSMLDQLRGTSSGPFTASPGVDLFPIVQPHKRIDPADVSATLDASVALPDTATVRPSNAEGALAGGQCPVPVPPITTKAGGMAQCAVWVKFPAKSLTIVYRRPARFGPYAGKIRGAHLVDLGGVQALAVDRGAEGQSPGWFQFMIGGTLQVTISGDYDTATLQAIAQSILDRSPIISPTQEGTRLTGWAGPSTVAHPIGGGAKVTLAEAAAAIGQPVVQPDTALIGPRDRGPVWALSRGTRGVVALTYPAQVLLVEYATPAHSSAREYSALAKGFPGDRVVRLGGTPVLEEPGNNPSFLVFAINGVEIRVEGDQDMATLESVARSIIDRSPSRVDPPGLNLMPGLSSRKPVALRNASRRLGAPVPLPEPRLLKPSTAGEGWQEGKCPGSGRYGCMIWIPFPSESVAILYQRPEFSYPRGRRLYESELKHARSSRVVELDGVSALEVPQHVGLHTAGRVEFGLDGMRVTVSGDRGMAFLEAIARSIVERSRSK